MLAVDDDLIMESPYGTLLNVTAVSNDTLVSNNITLLIADTDEGN